MSFQNAQIIFAVSSFDEYFKQVNIIDTKNIHLIRKAKRCLILVAFGHILLGGMFSENTFNGNCLHVKNIHCFSYMK